MKLKYFSLLIIILFVISFMGLVLAESAKDVKIFVEVKEPNTTNEAIGGGDSVAPEIDNGQLNTFSFNSEQIIRDIKNTGKDLLSLKFESINAGIFIIFLILGALIFLIWIISLINKKKKKGKKKKSRVLKKSKRIR